MPEGYAVDIVYAIICSHNRLFVLPRDRTLSFIVGQISMGEFPTIVDHIDALIVPLIPCIDVLIGVSGIVGIFKPRFMVDEDDSVGS